MAYNKRNVFSLSSGRQSAIEVSGRPCSLHGLWGRILPCLFQLHVPPGIPWLVTASLQSLPLSSYSLLCVSMSSLLSLVRTLVTGFRAHWHNPEYSYLKVLNLITSTKTLFQIRSHSKVPGVKMWTYLLGVHHATYYTTQPQN